MKRNIDMLKGPILPNIIRYTIPIIFTSILQLFFNTADLVVVGRFCGSTSVAAVSNAGPITGLIINTFIGLSVGAGVTTAHGLGDNNTEYVRRTVHTAVPLSLIAGMIVTIIGVCFSENFLIWMGTPENVLPLSSVYMRIYFCGITFSMVYNFITAILRAAGDTKSPLYFLILAVIVKVILNIEFVTVLNMNVAGVALSTIISQFISAVLVLITLCRRNDACKLQLKKIRFYKEPLLKIIRIGLPAGIQASLFSISNVLIQSSINSFGKEAIISGNGAAYNIESFLYAVLNSFHQTTVNFIGQNSGARQYSRLKKIVRYNLISVGVIGIVLAILINIFGKTLLSIYITDSHEAIMYGTLRFLYVTLPYFILGLSDVVTGGLRGLGASFISMVISVLGICGIRIIWVYTIFQIPQIHTLECLYLSYIISWTVTFIGQSIAYNKECKKLQPIL